MFLIKQLDREYFANDFSEINPRQCQYNELYEAAEKVLQGFEKEELEELSEKAEEYQILILPSDDVFQLPWIKVPFIQAWEVKEGLDIKKVRASKYWYIDNEWVKASLKTLRGFLLKLLSE